MSWTPSIRGSFQKCGADGLIRKDVASGNAAKVNEACCGGPPCDYCCIQIVFLGHAKKVFSPDCDRCSYVISGCASGVRAQPFTCEAIEASIVNVPTGVRLYGGALCVDVVSTFLYTFSDTSNTWQVAFEDPDSIVYVCTQVYGGTYPCSVAGDEPPICVFAPVPSTLSMPLNPSGSCEISGITC